MSSMFLHVYEMSSLFYESGFDIPVILPTQNLLQFVHISLYLYSFLVMYAFFSSIFQFIELFSLLLILSVIFVIALSIEHFCYFWCFVFNVCENYLFVQLFCFIVFKADFFHLSLLFTGFFFCWRPFVSRIICVSQLLRIFIIHQRYFE